MRQATRLRPTPFALAALLACLAQGAGAAAVSLSASTTSSANGTPGVVIPFSQNVPPTYVNSSSSVFDGPNNGSAFAFSNSTGAYAVSSQGQGIGTGNAATSLSYLFTNNGLGSSFTASFHIYGGGLSTLINSPLTGVEQLSSSYAATIKINGIQAFSSSASLLTTASGSTLSTSGTRLNAADDGTDGSYNWSSTDITLDLGFVATGQTIEILAELVSAASANVGTYDYDCGGGGYGGYGGYGGTAQTRVGPASSSICTDAKGLAWARYGDPLTISGGTNGADAEAPANQGLVTAVNATVPEPGALALSALALGAMLATRRRKRVAG